MQLEMTLMHEIFRDFSRAQLERDEICAERESLESDHCVKLGKNNFGGIIL